MLAHPALLGTVLVVVFTRTSSAAPVMAVGAGESKDLARQARAAVNASTPLRRLQDHVPNGVPVRRSDNALFYKFGHTWYYIDSPTACPMLTTHSKKLLDPRCSVAYLETIPLGSDVSAWCPTNGLGGASYEPFIGHLPDAVFTFLAPRPRLPQLTR